MWSQARTSILVRPQERVVLKTYYIFNGEGVGVYLQNVSRIFFRNLLNYITFLENWPTRSERMILNTFLENISYCPLHFITFVNTYYRIEGISETPNASADFYCQSNTNNRT